MIHESVIVKNRAGLHAKPASLFVQEANRFTSEIYVVKDKVRVNAKSIMGVMILAVQQGDTIEIEANGDDEIEAVDALKEMINNKFGMSDEN